MQKFLEFAQFYHPDVAQFTYGSQKVFVLFLADFQVSKYSVRTVPCRQIKSIQVMLQIFHKKSQNKFDVP
ncbi:MAG: hypothetical protein DCO96_04985 [Fluviicola sp. XM-24bin1]|nr:MAG: hypothetical protein DCO96_04985 [Fluviicola sp. XM-24bin1]